MKKLSVPLIVVTLAFIAGALTDHMLTSLGLAAPQRLPSIAAMQRRLNDEYGATLVVDGQLGLKTQTAWDAAYNAQCAAELWPAADQIPQSKIENRK